MVIDIDRNLDLCKNVACIHAGIHLHYRYTGNIITVDYRELNRSRTPVLRKQRRMHIDTAKLRDIEHSLRKDLTVSSCHDKVRLLALNKLISLIRLKRIRLINLYAQRLRLYFCRRCRQYMLSSYRLIRLGYA